MNILMLTDSMENGGAETHIYELSRSLCRLSHDVTVLSRGGAVAERLKAADIRHVTIPDLSARGGHLLDSLRAILATVREQKPTLIHAHTRQTVFLCRLLAPFLSVPVVFTAHAHFRAGGMGQLFRLFRGKTIAVSEDVARHLVCAFGRRREDITIIGNGIDTERFSPVKQTKHNEFRLLTVSRLDGDCALAATLLCRLLPTLCEQFSVSLTVVGGGDALPTLKALAKEVGASVHFAGERQDVRPYLAECDAFVGVSRAALEAMAMEKPVILCGNEGYLGILDENNMALAEQSNFCARGQALPTEETLASDLFSLLSATDARRATLGRLGRRAVLARHTADYMAHKTIEVYQNALRQHRACDLLLCGYYGFGNLGDELVLRSLAQGISAHATGVRIAALTGRGEPPTGVLRVSRRRPLALLRAVKRSGMVLLGGGTLLQSATSRRSLYYYLGLLAVARHFCVPFGILLGGVGPLVGSADKEHCAALLGDAAFVGLRDAESQRLLAELGIPSASTHLGADPVLTLPLPPFSLTHTTLTVFGRKGDDRDVELLDGIDQIARRYSLPVRVAAMDTSEDTDTATRLVRALTRRGVSAEAVPRLSYESLCSLLAASALVLTRRLHALMLACRMGVPALAVSDDPKLAAFLHEVFPTPLADRLSLDRKYLLGNDLAARAEYALLHRDALARAAAERLPLLAERVEKQLTLLVEKMLK